MSSFIKLLAVLSAGLLATGLAAEKPADPKAKKPETKDSKESGDKKPKKDKEKDKKKAKPPEDPNAPPKAIDIPMPNGHDAKVLKIPYRDENGKLKMRFNIGVATKTDDTHVEMSDLQIETFDDDGNHEMAMDLPTSTLDLTTSVITAHKAVKINREDFELTGNTMIFNTHTKQGGLGGDVRMVIYELEAETSSTPKAKAAPPAGEAATPTGVPSTPPASEKAATPEPKAK